MSAPDLSRETRWDGYPARALAHGVRAVYSSPLLVNDQPIGALNLYGTTTDPFDAAAQETAAQLTALAAATITAAMRHYNEATLTDHLRGALSSRSAIDQAIGIVMARSTAARTKPSTSCAPSPNTATSHPTGRRRPGRQDQRNPTPA